MKLISSDKQETVIALSQDEPRFLSSAKNETLEAIEEWEFQTRTGTSPEFAKRLLTDLNKIVDG